MPVLASPERHRSISRADRRTTATAVESNRLAWAAALLAVGVVAASGMVDATFGSDASGAASVWHYIAVAVQGVGCSVLASAAYSIFVEQAQAKQRERVRKDFLGLFGLPEMKGTPKCYIVLPQNDTLTWSQPAPSGQETAVGLKLPMPMIWGADTQCATRLQTMIGSVLGTAPQWIAPDDAIRIAECSEDPIIVFSVGLWSNAFSMFVCRSGERSLQPLIRLPHDPVCILRVAIPTPSGEYRVDTAFQDIAVSAADERGEVVLLRTRGPAQGKAACVVVGGLTASGTSVMGQYLLDHWHELCLLTDTSPSARMIRNHQYLIELKAFPQGPVLTAGVRSAASLVK